jgi:hypothetical protein
MKLNLGSYIYPLAGYLNVDVEHWHGVDQLVDLNKLPWPWEDESFTEIRAVDILEHLGKITKFEAVKELARITKGDGIVFLRVPSATHITALQSLQHAHSFYFDSFETDYAQPWFRCRRRWVTLYGGRLRVPFRHPLRPLLRFLGRLGLLYSLEFELEKIAR